MLPDNSRDKSAAPTAAHDAVAGVIAAAREFFAMSGGHTACCSVHNPARAMCDCGWMDLHHALSALDELTEKPNV